MGWYPFRKPGLPILQACTEDKDPEVGHCRGKNDGCTWNVKNKTKNKTEEKQKPKQNPTKSQNVNIPQLKLILKWSHKKMKPRNWLQNET